MTKQQAMQTVMDLFLEHSPYLHYVYTETSKRPDWNMFFKPDFFVNMLGSKKHMGFSLEEKIGQSNWKTLKDYCAWTRDNEYKISAFIKQDWDNYKKLQISYGAPVELVDSEFNFDLTFLVESFIAYCDIKKIKLV